MAAAAAALINLLQDDKGVEGVGAKAVVQKWAESTPTHTLLATVTKLKKRFGGKKEDGKEKKRRRRLLTDGGNTIVGAGGGSAHDIPHVDAAVLTRVLLDGSAVHLKAAVALYDSTFILQTSHKYSLPQHAHVQCRLLEALSSEQLAHVWLVPLRPPPSHGGSTATKANAVSTPGYFSSHGLATAAYSAAVASHNHLAAALRHVTTVAGVPTRNAVIHRLLAGPCSIPDLAAKVLAAAAIFTQPQEVTGDTATAARKRSTEDASFMLELIETAKLESTLVEAICILDSAYTQPTPPPPPSSLAAAMAATATPTNAGNILGCPVDMMLSWTLRATSLPKTTPAQHLTIVTFAAKLRRAANAPSFALDSGTAAAAAFAVDAAAKVVKLVDDDVRTLALDQPHQHRQGGELAVVRALLQHVPNLDLDEVTSKQPAGSASASKAPASWQSILSTVSSKGAVKLLQLLDVHNASAGGGGGGGAGVVGGQDSTSTREMQMQLLPPLLDRSAMPVVRVLLHRAHSDQLLSEFVRHNRNTCVRFIAATEMAVAKKAGGTSSAQQPPQLQHNHCADRQSPSARDALLVAALCSVDIALLPGAFVAARMVPTEGSVSALQTKLESTHHQMALSCFTALCLESKRADSVEKGAGGTGKKQKGCADVDAAGRTRSSLWLSCLGPQNVQPSPIGSLVKAVQHELSNHPPADSDATRPLQLLWGLCASLTAVDLNVNDLQSIQASLLSKGEDQNGANSDYDDMATVWTQWIRRFPMRMVLVRDGSNAEQAKLLVLEMLRTLHMFHSFTPNAATDAPTDAPTAPRLESTAMIELVRMLILPEMRAVLSAAKPNLINGEFGGGGGGGGGKSSAHGHVASGMHDETNVSLSPPEGWCNIRLEALFYLCKRAAAWILTDGSQSLQQGQQLTRLVRGDAATLIATVLEAAANHTNAFACTGSGITKSRPVSIGADALECSLSLLGQPGDPSWLGAQIASEAHTKEPNLQRLCASIVALASAAGQVGSIAALNTSAQLIASVAMLGSTPLTVLISAGVMGMLLEVLESGVSLGNTSLALQMVVEALCSPDADADAGQRAAAAECAAQCRKVPNFMLRLFQSGMAVPFNAVDSATTLENMVRILADAMSSSYLASNNLFAVREIVKCGWSTRLATSAAVASTGANADLEELWRDPDFLCDVVKVEVKVCKTGGLLPMALKDDSGALAVIITAVSSISSMAQEDASAGLATEDLLGLLEWMVLHSRDSRKRLRAPAVKDALDKWAARDGGMQRRFGQLRSQLAMAD